MTFIAALPMYDWQEARADTDAEWQGLRARLLAAGVDAPQELVRRNSDLPAVPGGIRDAGGQAIAPDPASLPPDGLDFPTLWKHPDLLLAQTCWGPMEEGLARHVVVIGQPSYDGIEGGEGEFYSSAILMRREAVSGHCREGRCSVAAPFDALANPETSAIGESAGEGSISPLEGEMAGRPEGGGAGRRAGNVAASPDGRAILPLVLLRNARLAYNSMDSMSGVIALKRDLEVAGETLAIFSGLVETAAHRASLVAVAEGRADVCAIDCRSWHLAKLHEPRAADLEVVGWTARRKGLPFITSRHTPPDVVARLRSALA